MRWRSPSSVRCCRDARPSRPSTGARTNLPEGLSAQTHIKTNGTQLHVRVGGSGPAVVLLHGYRRAICGSRSPRICCAITPWSFPIFVAWAYLQFPRAATTRRPSGYRGCAGRAQDRPCRPGHSRHRQHGRLHLAASYRNRVTRLSSMRRFQASVPWEEILKNPLLWHFRFGGPDMERLPSRTGNASISTVFGMSFSATPARFSEAAARHYAKLYARPGAMRAGFAQFAAFDRSRQQRSDSSLKESLMCRSWLCGGEKSFGLAMADVMRFAATNVEGGAVPEFWSFDYRKKIQRQPSPWFARFLRKADNAA